MTTRKNWIECVQEYMDSCTNPDFVAYRGGLSASDERFVWLVKHLISLGRMRDGRVLDIGCGFGWDAAAISLAANASVLANDIRPEMTSVVEQCVTALQKKGVDLKVDTLTGDICDVTLAERSFDAIVCQQTLEHVHDLDRLMKVCFRLLKPGGRAIFTNDNNILNRTQFARIQEMWKRRDRDWAYIDQLRRARPIENRDIKPYAVMRREIVTSAKPNLGEPTITKIVDATAGLVAAEIKQVAVSYVEGQKLPTPSHSSWCRNPVTGEYCERQLNPYEIANQLVANGFVAAQVRHGLRRWPMRWLNGLEWRWFNEIIFSRKAFFIVLASKSSISA